ncbi:hypothetical protein [Virgibacillus salexigens]|uniref:hypothetical protein n=1 Tax=Virgibacillus massiliensis TaxID=1462526 RepID=UPI00136EC2D3|nr:hypothetical protein [Virgibacillus massiliensis]MYL41236.1 hypothetical protein [Virgibacillus massiliensis]
MNLKQIKCKNRVLDHGEVLTPNWLVNDMLDMIPAEGMKISSRYLENSSGEGAFLLGILNRKLELIFNTYSDIEDRKFYTIVGISNIYGVELLKDNVEISKSRLLELVKDYFNHRYKLGMDIQFLRAIEHIIDINIINMDALTHKVPIFKNNKLNRDEDGNIVYSDELGRISEWEIDYRTREIERVEYYYIDIVREQEDQFQYEKILKETEPTQLSLFDFNYENDLFNMDNFIRVAKPIRTFAKTSYLNLYNANVLKDGIK